MEELKKVYGDILRGMSPFYFEPIKADIYIKHATALDNCDVDNVYNRYFEIAQKKGLPVEAKKLEYLDKKNLWTKKQEKELSELSDFIDRLKQNKSKLHLPSQRELIDKQIEEEDKKLRKLEAERTESIGLTAELYASRQMNEFYLRNATFKDKNINNLLYSQEEYDNLDTELTYSLINIYTKFNQLFTQATIKKVALMPLFMNSFYLCQDNAYYYYGKPIVELTMFQADLFGFGRLFKNILSEHRDKIPTNYLNDPDKILDWYEGNKNAEQIMNKQPMEGAVSLVGAKKEDYEKMGMSGELAQSNILVEKAKQKGGKLSMKDLIALQGG